MQRKRSVLWPGVLFTQYRDNRDGREKLLIEPDSGEEVHVLVRDFDRICRFKDPDVVAFELRSAINGAVKLLNEAIVNKLTEEVCDGEKPRSSHDRRAHQSGEVARGSVHGVFRCRDRTSRPVGCD